MKMTVPTLSDFIDKHTELILDNWVVFAKSIITNTITLVARDHAAGLLRAIVSDMKTPETADQQPDKAKDFSRQDVKNSDAELHGAARQEQGYSFTEAVSEFRAFRATIIR